MALTMTDEREAGARKFLAARDDDEGMSVERTLVGIGKDVFSELDATRARAAELERHLAAREAECVELRQVGEAMRVAVSTGGRYQAACEAFIAALSRPPRGTEALRAMLAKAVKKSWDGAMEYAASGQYDISLTDVEAEGIVSRLLGDARGETPRVDAEKEEER